MLTPNRFEELLAAYPAEKRELARQVYHRFAEGDSTQFFTQLFLVLDIYAHYAERIPQAVVEASQSAHANLAKLRDEINLLAQGMDRRNVNIADQAERTDELCNQAIAACNATSEKVQALPKNISAQIDSKAIVDGIRAELDKGIRDEIIAPFIKHSRELGERVVPALKKIEDASATAHGLWMKHIWKTAWAGSFLFASTLSVIVLFTIDRAYSSYAEREAAKRIASFERVMNYNRDAFRELAIAQVPIRVVRTTDTNGATYPRGFALLIENADSAEMRQIDGHDAGMIFFAGHLPEDEIQQVQQELEKLTNAPPARAK